MDDLREWDLAVGRVAGRWDKASLKVQPWSETESYFAVQARLCAAPQGGERRLLQVRTSRRIGKSYILDCGLASSEIADALRGATLFVHPSMRPALAEGEFYIDALLGLQVVTESGEAWGEIEEIIETPAHDVYVTPQAMIPDVPEFIVSIDFEAKTVTVREIPGLRADRTDQPEEKSA